VKERLLSWARSAVGTGGGDPYKPLWIDAPGAERRLDEIQKPEVRAALKALMSDGYAVLRKNVPPDQCDELVRSFNAHCDTHPEHKDFSDRYGLHDRLAGFHLASPAAQKLAASPLVLDVVRCVLDETPLVAGSLFFERGSEQDIHRDTPAFFTVPLNHFLGVWHALEDIHPDAGALTYYVGGHRCLPDRGFVGTGYDNMPSYFRRVKEACQSQGLAVSKFSASKGDTLIWHPQLPHGGSRIADPSRSRKSIVFHYMAASSPLWGPHEFFGPPEKVSSKPNMRRIPLGNGLNALDWGAPKFIKNVPEGNFKD